MKTLKGTLCFFLIISFSHTSFAQEKSEQVAKVAKTDFSYDLLQKSFSKSDRIAIVDKDNFIKELQKVNFVYADVYFSGVGFKKVEALKMAGNVAVLKDLLDRVVAGTQITFDNATIKNNDGTLIKGFQKGILFY